MREKLSHIRCWTGVGVLVSIWMVAGLSQTVPPRKEYVRLGSRVVAVQDFTPATDTGKRNPAQIAAYNDHENDGHWAIDRNGNYSWDGTTIDKLVFWRTGNTTNIPVSGDWNGDGRTKIGIYSNGTWLLDYDGDGLWNPAVDIQVNFGSDGFKPVVGDWNGTGWTKIGVYKDGTFLLDYNGNFAWDGPQIDKAVFFGGQDYLPVVGDWNGSGTTKIGTYINSTYFIDRNGNFTWDGTGPGNDVTIFWGGSGYIPVVGDWNGSGWSKIGAYKDGLWLLDYDGDFIWGGTSSDRYESFGSPGYLPVVGDWHDPGMPATGISKIGVYFNGTWTLDANGNFTSDGPPGDKFFNFGGTGQIPVVGRWQ